MPWGVLKNETLPALENKSIELRKIFSEVANKALSEGKTEEESIFAGLSSVSQAERKKQKELKKALDEQKARASYVPEHLRIIKEAQELKKQQKLEAELLVQQEEQNKIQELKASIISEIQKDSAKSIIDMQVLGEDVLLVHKDGTKVKRRLADYTVNQNVVVAGGGQEPTFTNASPSLGVGGIPSGSTFESVPVTEMWSKLLYPFSVALAASPSLVEIGTVVPDITLSWSTSVPDAVLSLNQGIGDVTGLSTYLYTTPTSSNITFTLTGTSAGMTRTANASTSFRNRVITAVTPNLVPSEVELLAAGGVLSDSYVRTVSYDCTGGNRFYIAYPSRLGAMSGAQVNNLPWNDWTQSIVSHTNSSGYTEDYIILVSNNLVYGAAVPVKWGV